MKSSSQTGTYLFDGVFLQTAKLFL